MVPWGPRSTPGGTLWQPASKAAPARVAPINHDVFILNNSGPKKGRAQTHGYSGPGRHPSPKPSPLGRGEGELITAGEVCDAARCARNEGEGRARLGKAKDKRKDKRF